MKLWTIYCSIFIIILSGFVLMVSSNPHPEDTISGKWEEVSWKYEKVNKPDKATIRDYSSAEIKQMIGQDLVIHEAEKWTFLPNGRLQLEGNNDTKTVEWRIKGRGHILQIKYDGGVVENYNITFLNNSQLVLNFDLEVKAKGIAQLTFNRI